MLRCIKIPLFTLVLIVSLVGSPMESLRTVWADCPPGDLSGDCIVNLEDLKLFAGQWLEPYDLADFTVLAADWRENWQTGSLQVTILPAEAVTAGAKWQVDDGPWRDSNDIESGLPVGWYTVEFNEVDGWIRPADEIVQIDHGQTTLISRTYIEQTGASLVISEFMASNDSTLATTVDGQEVYPDWIEVYNPTDTAISLDGWYLTDSNSNLTKWQFPDGLVIEPGEFLIVFASNKDYENYPGNYPYLDDANYYHTNFKLDKNPPGEYLALVAADGNTIAHEYAPEYPEQLTDISYGLTQYATALVPTGATASYYVPTISDADANWTALDFDDSGWEAGPTGLGFGNPSPGFEVTYYKANIAVNNLTDAESVISDPSKQANVVTEMSPVINYNNTNTPGHFSSDNPFPSTTIGSDVEDFVIEATCIVQIPEAGDWTFGVHSDDGFSLELTGPGLFYMDYPNLRGPGDSFAVFNVTTPGPYNLRLVFFERGGGSGVELFAAKGSFSVFNSTDFHLVGDTASGGLQATSFSSEVSTDVQEQMQNINASLWTRLEFHLEEGERDIFDTLMLRMKYEDGFVAYLNGQKVAERNAPASLQWDSTALGDRPMEDAFVFEAINLMAYLDTLQTGTNMLAIHGLNDIAADPNLLILPELVAATNVSIPQYFTTATPGTFNVPGALGLVADTEFSHNRGFYVEDFNVTITSDTPDAAIRYTTDGTTPTEMHGDDYIGPIPISTTTCLRAMAWKVGWLHANVDTQTYIFLDNVIQQPNNPAGFPSLWGSTTADYEMDPDVIGQDGTDLFGGIYAASIKDDLKSIPTMSLVMKLDDLFGSSGIYSNPTQSGVAWERPGSIELFYPDGSEGFQVNCGVRIYGGAFRGMNLTRKKTFRLLFKGIYGPSKLRYPLFDEDAADEFDTIILRGGANDAWNNWGDGDTQYIVDEFMRRTQLALGQPSAHGTFVHLYINGLYWGLYNPVERPDSSFAATYFGGDKEDWDTLNSGSPCGESSTATWNAMLNLVRQGLTTTEAYQRLQGNNPDGTNNPAYDDLLDVDNHIDYMFSNFWGGTGDWPGHNWYVGCRRPPNATGFKFFNWDSEGAIVVWSDLNANRTSVNNGAAEPYGELRQNTEFCLLFADHVQRHLFNNGPAISEPSYARYEELADQVERAIVCESARWGDQARSTPYTLADWQAKCDYVLGTYMPQRPDIVLGQLRNAGLYPDVNAPVFYINGSYQHGGQTSTGDELTMTNTNGSGTIWYTIDGNDPRLPAGDSPPGTILVAEDAAKRVLVPTGDIGDTWRTTLDFNDLGWNDGTPIIPGKTGGVGYERSSGYGNYITYNVEAGMYGNNTTCYIRIPFTFNGDPNDFNFMTLKMRYDDGFVAYLNGVKVKAVYEPSPLLWNSWTDNNGSHEAGSSFDDFDISDPNYIGALRQGDNLLAIHGLNNSTTSTDFLISVELVAGEQIPAGVSPSAIEYIPPTPVTLNKSTHVMARVLDGITWSALNEATFAVGPVADNLRITEMMYHPQDTGDPNNDPNAEFIELKNIGTGAINLALVRFTNGIDFTFPSLQLGPGDYVLVVKDQAVFASRYTGVPPTVDILGPYEGRLANAGERIRLQDAIGQTILDFEYSDGWRPITDGDGFSLTIIEPNDSAPCRPDEGLVAHWKFDDGTGSTFALDSVGTNNGTLYGDSTWTTGQIGGALSFDGNGDYVSLSAIAALAGDSLTVEAWIRVNDFGAIWNPILVQHNSSSDGYYLYVYGDKSAFYIVGGGSFAQAISPDAINVDQWYHVAGTNDGSSLKIYVNGRLKSGASSVGLTGVNHSAYIGYDDNTSYYNGLIDDVRIYNRPLREDEFQDIADPTGRWSRKDSWRASDYVGGSPGDDDTGVLPNPGAVVINEVMAHSHSTDADWIELYNTTNTAIDIGGWFLSDNDANLMKYRIPDGTTIAGSGPNKYLVFSEDSHFGNTNGLIPFAFSENGEVACLSSADGNVLTGYREVEDFGASETGVSFGRYYKASTNNYNFVAMDSNTPGWANALPKVGPIVINEIMYHPDWPEGGSYNNDDYEYIELHNITGSPVTLYDYETSEPWKLTDGIDFTFPASPDEVTIPADGYLLVVKNLAAFAWRYPSVPSEKVLGPYDGRLNNAGERVEISMPGDVDEFGRRCYIRIDRVNYSDGWHPEDCPGGVDLWPPEADGGGQSLSRIDSDLYGNDVINWRADDPSPGSANP